MNKSYEYLDNICLIKTNKYKTISVYFNYSKPYDLKSKLILNILTKFVGQYSNLYNSKQAMGKAVDMLYGASLQSSVKVKANLLLFNIKYSFINPRFLNDLNIEDFLEYMDECLHNVYFSKDLLNEFKKVYKDTVARVLDNPKNYAKNQVVKLIGQKEENFLIYDLDHVNEIDAISLEDIKNVYKNLLKDFSCDIYVVGDFDDELIKHLEKYKSPCRFSLMNKPIEIEDIGEVIEEKDISQSCLNIVYTNNNNRLNKDFYAYDRRCPFWCCTNFLVI